MSKCDTEVRQLVNLGREQMPESHTILILTQHSCSPAAKLSSRLGFSLSSLVKWWDQIKWSVRPSFFSWSTNNFIENEQITQQPSQLGATLPKRFPTGLKHSVFTVRTFLKKSFLETADSAPTTDRSTDYIYGGLFLESLFCPIDPFVYSLANTTLPWLL